jgi:transcriptional regulator with XRE-family HTH domain
MSQLTAFERLLEEFRNDPDFVAEQLVLIVGEAMVECMGFRGMRRADLAKQMGVSKAYITKLLNGKPNVTLRTLAHVAVALGANVDLTMRCPETSAAWAGYTEKWSKLPEARPKNGRTHPRYYEEAQTLAAAA